MWALMCLEGKELMRIELMSTIRELLWNTALLMSAEQTDKEEISRAHIQSTNLMWQADISNRLKRLDRGSYSWRDGKKLNSGKKRSSNIHCLCPSYILSPLIQSQRPPEENTFQLNYPTGTKEPCQTKKREKVRENKQEFKSLFTDQRAKKGKDRHENVSKLPV